MNAPCRSTAVFDETTLPGALRRAHRTKAGAWGVIRVLEAAQTALFGCGKEEILTPNRPGLVLPEQVHRVEPMGTMRMQVDFYDRPPASA